MTFLIHWLSFDESSEVYLGGDGRAMAIGVMVSVWLIFLGEFAK